jgi:hypothetical protein
MIKLGVSHGIYLVVWFDKLKWDLNDHRRQDAPNASPPEINLRLEAQAREIPPGYLVMPLVIDCRAP